MTTQFTDSTQISNYPNSLSFSLSDLESYPGHVIHLDVPSLGYQYSPVWEQLLILSYLLYLYQS